jgi:very-short-patch-repair endonuclease
MSQKKFELCRDKHCLPFDNMIEDCNTLIEFDGGQHFESIEFFGGKTAYTKRRMHDVMKNKFCLENNYLLLRIAHTEIDYIEQLIDRAIYMHSEDKTGIIFSNPSLYKGAYL